MSGKPKSYQENECCHNCKHVFQLQDYDSGSEYFCTFKSPTRPKCGSVFMQEIFGGMPSFYKTIGAHNKAWITDDKAWDKWSKKRQVQAWGTCKEQET